MNIILNILFVSTLIAAEEAREMIVPQRTEKPYEIGELVCVDGKSGETECGKVTSVGTDVVHINLEAATEGVEFLDGTLTNEEIKKETAQKPSKKLKKSKKEIPETIPVPSSEPVLEAKPEAIERPQTPVVVEVEKEIVVPLCTRTLAALAPSVDPNMQDNYQRNLKSIALYGSFGVDHYLLGPEFQKPFSMSWTAAFAPFFSFGSSPVTSVFAFGAYARFLHKPLIETPSFYLAPGIGVISIKSTVNISENTYSMTALLLAGTAGYRMDFEDSFFMAIEAGLQYISSLGGDSNKVDFKGLQPVTFIQLGMTFF